MDNKVAKAKIGSGGRLYRDARPEPKDDTETVDGESAQLEMPLLADRPDRPEAPQQPQWGTAGVYTPPQPKVVRDWRAINSTLVELMGMALLASGFWMLMPWLGFVVLGICTMVFGVALGIPPTQTPHTRTRLGRKVKP